jgi:hypothetical protein
MLDRRCLSRPACREPARHVPAAGEHVVEPAGADVVSPAVATDNPHTATDQVLHDAAQVSDQAAVELVEALISSDTRSRCACSSRTVSDHAADQAAP